jgi:hypothetical protein
LGDVVTEMGNGTTVSGGPQPTLWKGASGNFETMIALDLEVKKVLDGFGEAESVSAQLEGKLEQALRDITSLKREVVQVATLRSDFQDQRTRVGALEGKLGSLSNVLGSIDVAIQCSTPSGSSGDLIDGEPLTDVVNTLTLQVEVIQSRMHSQAGHMGGISFESYEDTCTLVCTNLNENDWPYILDMPFLYSMVHRDGNDCITRLDEDATACTAGYDNTNNARLALSYTSMVPDIFEPGKKTKVEGHPFPAIDSVSKLESSGVQKGFHDEVEYTINAN